VGLATPHKVMFTDCEFARLAGGHWLDNLMATLLASVVHLPTCSKHISSVLVRFTFRCYMLAAGWQPDIWYASLP